MALDPLARLSLSLGGKAFSNERTKAIRSCGKDRFKEPFAPMKRRVFVGIDNQRHPTANEGAGDFGTEAVVKPWVENYKNGTFMLEAMPRHRHRIRNVAHADDLR